MDKLSGIASDYLEDFEILQEARNQLHRELGNWWKEIVERVLAELENEAPFPVEHWDNQASPGYIEIYAEGGAGLLKITVSDPRHCGHASYAIALLAPSRPKLKSLSSGAAQVETLDEAASNAGFGPLAWDSTTMAQIEVDIKAEDPDAVLLRVAKEAVKLFRLVILSEAGARKVKEG